MFRSKRLIMAESVISFVIKRTPFRVDLNSKLSFANSFMTFRSLMRRWEAAFLTPFYKFDAAIAG